MTILEKLDLIYSFALMMCNEDNEPLLTEYKNEIETALKDYENLQLKHRSMQDAVLDDFKKLKDIDEIMSNHNCSNLSELNEKLCDYEESKFDDDLKQKKLKAFEIIKEKRVNIDGVIYFLKNEKYRDRVCHWYNGFSIDIDKEPERALNEEDLICLKEVLK